MAKKTFNLKEIIEMAVQIEVAGVAFYKSLTEKAQSEGASKLFGYLEEAEHQHIRDFEKVLESALEKHHNLEYPASEQELLYLRAFASRKVFDGPEDAKAKAAATSNTLEGIDLALEFEFRSVAFFQEMARLIEDPEDKASVEELERQEREHVANLMEYREKLTESG